MCNVSVTLRLISSLLAGKNIGSGEAQFSLAVGSALDEAGYQAMLLNILCTIYAALSHMVDEDSFGREKKPSKNSQLISYL